MADLLTLENVNNLIMLCFLQAVSGLFILPTFGFVLLGGAGPTAVCAISNIPMVKSTLCFSVGGMIRTGYRGRLDTMRAAVQKHS